MLRWLLTLADAARHRARLGRWADDQALGRRGEDLAHRFLERRGLVVVARNHRPASGIGEIDLVAWDGDTLAFIEVKCRRSREHGAPERNVDADKERALVSAARHYARQAGVPWERVRIDVVSVVLGDPPRLSHWRDAIRVPARI
jgi:putative endonuclease